MGSILIVEDDRAFAETLALLFKIEGYKVLMTSYARDAIKIGVAEQPDLVVADWFLGGNLHGDEVCRQIRQIHPGVKTVIVTGCLDISQKISRSSEGKDIDTVVIEKPFHKERLLEIVRKLFADTAISTA